jgi:hypothetical protein
VPLTVVLCGRCGRSPPPADLMIRRRADYPMRSRTLILTAAGYAAHNVHVNRSPISGAGPVVQCRPMSRYTFERDARTPFSESYVVQDGETDVGRVDIHFAQSGMVHATLCVPSAFDEDAVEELIAEIDERLVLAADAYRDDFIVTVWRGERMGVYSEETEDDADTNGAGPH